MSVPTGGIATWNVVSTQRRNLLRRAMTPTARLVVYVLRAARVGFDPARLREWAREVEDAGATAGVEAIALLFGHLSEVDGGAALHQALLDAIESEELREDVMGLRKEWEDKARAEGRAELLLKLLRLKFGELPATVSERVQRGSADELERWAERVLTATTLEDVLR